MKRLPLCALLACLLASTSPAAVVFDQPHDGSGAVHKSSWYPPNGLDGDVYCWDDFQLASGAAITEVHWRGAYELHPTGTGQSPVSDFEVSIYRSIGGGSQPDLGPGGRLAQYAVGGNAAETAAGAFGGVQMFDYGYTLPSPFPAAAGTRYWVEIVAAQGAAAPSFAPDWGLAVGTGGDNSHFRVITGGPTQALANDLAFSLVASDAPGVTIAATASPAGAGSVAGAGTYPVGSLVTLTATPNPGWGFVQWTEAGVPASASATYSFTATVNRTLVAVFDTAYTIATSCYPLYAGTVTGGGTYLRNSMVTLLATPAHGFVFDSWSDGPGSMARAFPATSDLLLFAFFASAPDAVTFDLDGGPLQAPLPVVLTENGLSAHLSGGYSIQPVGTLGISPAGFSGLCLWPSSVFPSDLGIVFSDLLTDFSMLYAVNELACDTSARMRVSAYLDGAFVGTSTMIAPVPGSYPSATLALTVPTGFNSVVVHWDAPGTGCQDYAPIFFADNITVTRVLPLDAGPGPRATLRLEDPAPNPFGQRTRIAFQLPRSGEVRLDVHDLLGRHVRTLLREALPAGPRSLEWDRRDDAGRRVRPGVYLLRLASGGEARSLRLLVMD